MNTSAAERALSVFDSWDRRHGITKAIYEDGHEQFAVTYYGATLQTFDDQRDAERYLEGLRDGGRS